MSLNPKLRQHIFEDLRAAVDHQGILSDIIVPLAELRGLEPDQVLSWVQEMSIMADTGRDLTATDLESFFELKPEPEIKVAENRCRGTSN